MKEVRDPTFLIHDGGKGGRVERYVDVRAGRDFGEALLLVRVPTFRVRG